ncbi:MAG: PfkB family carbohydrate kinase [Roseinatronobacter sp.]
MIVCAGENLIDVIEQPAAAGARAFTAHVGGSPYNCSRAIARLGGAAGYLGAISTDSFGAQLLDTLAADGVQFLGARVMQPTTLAMVTVTKGQPDYRFYRDNTAERQVTHDTLRAALPPGMQALHMSSIALVEGQDAEAWADVFCDNGDVFTSLDPNVRALIAEPNRAGYAARLARMAQAAHLIRLSDEDAAWWFPGLSPAACVGHLATLAPQAVIVLTQGPGLVLCHGPAGRFEVMPPVPPKLVDTVGAGDTLMAALLVGLFKQGALSANGLRALPASLLHQVVTDATRAAALTCARAGCNPPYAPEVWG